MYVLSALTKRQMTIYTSSTASHPLETNVLISKDCYKKLEMM